MLGCAEGEHSSRKLAEIIAGATLALDISLVCAIGSHTFTDAHMKYGRKQNRRWMCSKTPSTHTCWGNNHFYTRYLKLYSTFIQNLFFLPMLQLLQLAGRTFQTPLLFYVVIITVIWMLLCQLQRRRRILMILGCWLLETTGLSPG